MDASLVVVVVSTLRKYQFFVTSTPYSSYFSLYWIPPDFEYAASNGWPSGWNTISSYVAKVLARLPSNDNPSTDGVRYIDQVSIPLQVLVCSRSTSSSKVYTLISTFLNYQGYSNITINSNPNQKDHAYGHPAYDVRTIQLSRILLLTWLL